uniref:Uncharacterized protein n=1 Tax=viral metagenome TaxID=1070528 RepID=A0A6C0ARX9_9ZZZZ
MTDANSDFDKLYESYRKDPNFLNNKVVSIFVDHCLVESNGKRIPYYLLGHAVSIIDIEDYVGNSGNTKPFTIESLETILVSRGQNIKKQEIGDSPDILTRTPVGNCMVIDIIFKDGDINLVNKPYSVSVSTCPKIIKDKILITNESDFYYKKFINDEKSGLIDVMVDTLIITTTGQKTQLTADYSNIFGFIDKVLITLNKEAEFKAVINKVKDRMIEFINNKFSSGISVNRESYCRNGITFMLKYIEKLLFKILFNIEDSEVIFTDIISKKVSKIEYNIDFDAMMAKYGFNQGWGLGLGFLGGHNNTKKSKVKNSRKTKKKI